MGMMFPLQYANLIAHLTADSRSVECSLRDLRGFFYMLFVDEWRLITSGQDDQWPAKMRELAKEAVEVVGAYAPVPERWDELAIGQALRRAGDEGRSIPIDEPVVSINDVFAKRPDVLERFHAALRNSHDIFVLGVASGNNDAQAVGDCLRAVLYDGPSVSMLFLLPDDPFSRLDFPDPFPGASEICRMPERWPGVLFWNKFNCALFLPLRTAASALRNAPLLKRFAGIRSQEDVLKIEQGYALSQVAQRQVRLLHISDLHFGSRYAAMNQDYLLAVIKGLSGSFDRVVITGDLFDSVLKRKWQAFQNFLQSLRLITDNDPVVIPGNHDTRILGNRIWRFGESYRYLAEVETRPLVEDSDLQCLFFCFNSAKAGNFARGEVLEEDLVRRGQEYQTLAARNPKLQGWLRVALVHHHPFKFDVAAEGMTATILKALRIPESQLLDMNESERFVSWCADRSVQLILHGHRHVQRKISQAVPVQGVHGITPIEVTAIGCGTSLGAEGIPKSFNLITWHPSSARWSSAFYLDRSGGGFKEVRATSTTLAPVTPG